MIEQIRNAFDHLQKKIFKVQWDFCENNRSTDNSYDWDKCKFV